MKNSAATPIILHLHITHAYPHEVLPPITLSPAPVPSLASEIHRVSLIERVSGCFFLAVIGLMVATMAFCLLHMPIPI